MDRRWNTGQCDELQNTTDNNTDSFSSLSVSVFPVQLLLSAHWLNDLTEVLPVPKRLLRPESVLRIKSLLNPLCLPVINVYRQRAPTVFNQRAEEQTKSEDTFWLLWVYTDFYDGCFFLFFFIKTKFICSFSENSKILYEDLLLFLIYSTCGLWLFQKKKVILSDKEVNWIWRLIFTLFNICKHVLLYMHKNALF